MTAVPRYRTHAGPAILSAGFRPFFLAGAVWAAVAIPLWLAVYAGDAIVPTLLQPLVWHAHEMVFGFAAAVVAGFLLTAIPNWTGRLPLQGLPLLTLAALWAIGRIAVLLSARIGAPLAAIADLAFPALFLAVVAREIIAGRNWRNLPMLGALTLLLAANLLVHLEALDVAGTAALGNRLGIATLLMLIGLVGGRIVPSFTRNWLTKARPEVRPPAAPEGGLDRAALIVTALGLACWVSAPDMGFSGWVLVIAGAAVALRLSRWRGLRTTAEPLLLILHVGYGWLALGLLLLGADLLTGLLPYGAALHALTVGAIGTMTLAVMTRASLGHTGRPLTAGSATVAIYLLISLAAVLRFAAPFDPGAMQQLLSAAGAAWSAAFVLFAVFYGAALVRPRPRDEAKPI
ncbi:MAG: NnrS family protein [Alphaproteobacteria bacterium]